MLLEQIVAHDKALSQRLTRQVDGRYLRAIAWIVARSGDSWLWITIIAYLIWQNQALGWDLLWTVVATAILVFLCKAYFKRERPAESRLAIAADKYAFPSGHAARAGAVGITLAYFFPQIRLAWLIWAVLVAIARVALSRHYLTDVLGGLLLGLIVGISLQMII